MDIKYFAGLFDGEGTITLTRERNNSVFRRLVLSLQLCDEALVRDIKEAFGGGISTRIPRKNAYSQAWTWTITNHRALKILELLAPHLRLLHKKARADMVLRELPALIRKNGKYTNEERCARLAFEARFFNLTNTRMSPILDERCDETTQTCQDPGAIPGWSTISPCTATHMPHPL